MTSPAEKSESPAWRSYLLVAAVAAVVCFWRLGAQTMDNHECRAALAARTMIDHDRWILPGEVDGTVYSIPPDTPLNRLLVPVENGRPRLVKTPLGYWLTAAASLHSGEVTGFTARLPSAIAGVLTALVTLALGRRLLPARAALFGALMLATSYGFQRWTRNARPEALLTLFMTAAMACFYLGLSAGGRRRLAWMAAFWVSMGLANLAKPFVPLLLAWPILAFVCWRQAARRGDEHALRLLRRFLAASLLGLALVAAVSAVEQLHWWRLVGVGRQAGYYATFAVCVGLPVLWLLIRSRGRRPVAELLPTALPGLAVMLLMFVPWMAYMVRLFPELAGDVFRGQVTERAAAAAGWVVDRPWLYVESLVAYTFLWLPLLPAAVAHVLSRRLSSGRAGRVYLLLWSAGLFLLFTAAAGKRDHYILPALPPLFLLCGSFADVLLRRAPRGRLVRLLGWTYAAVSTGAFVVMTAVAINNPDKGNFHLLAVVAAAAIPGLTAGVIAAKGRSRPLVPLVATAAVVVYVAHAAGIELWDRREPVRQFARQADQTIPPDQPVYHWNDPQPMAAFYVGRQLPAVQWRFAEVADRHGRYEARRRLGRWMGSPDAPRWMLGYAHDAPLLQRWGYRKVLETPAPESRRQDLALYQK